MNYLTLGQVMILAFCRLNNFDLITSEDDAVETIIKVASGEMKEEDLSIWIKNKLVNKKY